jgi:hypothetical protein
MNEIKLITLILHNNTQNGVQRDYKIQGMVSGAGNWGKRG